MPSLKSLIYLFIVAYLFTNLFLEKGPDMTFYQDEHDRWTLSFTRSHHPQRVVNNKFNVHTSAESITNHVQHNSNHLVSNKHTSNRNIGWNVGDSSLVYPTKERLLNTLVEGFQKLLSTVTGYYHAPSKVEAAHALDQGPDRVCSQEKQAMYEGLDEGVDDLDTVLDAV